MSSSNAERGVVVTGMGVVSPIGIGLQEFWNSLLAGQSGVRIRDEFANTDLPLRFYSPVTGFEGKQWVKPRKALKVMCEPIQFGYAAARMAADQAGMVDGVFDPERIGTVFGSETFFSEPENVTDVFHQCVVDGVYQHDRWGATAMREIQPLWMLKYLPNMATSHVSIAVDARGPSNTICQREVSGLLALIEGQDLIRRGVCDAVVVGGTGCCTSLTVNIYHGIELLSNAQNQPEKSCRPFEMNRDGTVFGEGAGAIVLESEQHALERGADVLCRLASTTRNFIPPPGGSHDHHDKDGFTQAITDNLAATLERSGMAAEQIGHLNANGLGSPEWDPVEARAISNVLSDVPTIGLKSYFGYLGAGASIVELIASVLSLRHGELPSTLNYDTPDPECPCNVNSRVIQGDQKAAIKLAYSVHGQIVSAAITT